MSLVRCSLLRVRSTGPVLVSRPAGRKAFPSASTPAFRVQATQHVYVRRISVRRTDQAANPSLIASPPARPPSRTPTDPEVVAGCNPMGRQSHGVIGGLRRLPCLASGRLPRQPRLDGARGCLERAVAVLISPAVSQAAMGVIRACMRVVIRHGQGLEAGSLSLCGRILDSVPESSDSDESRSHLASTLRSRFGVFIKRSTLQQALMLHTHAPLRRRKHQTSCASRSRAGQASQRRMSNSASRFSS